MEILGLCSMQGQKELQFKAQEEFQSIVNKYDFSSTAAAGESSFGVTLEHGCKA